MDWSDYYAFYVYDENTSSTAPIEVSDIPELSEQELEFIYDDKIRKVWHSQEEEWYFSIIDVIDVLTDSSDPKQYVKSYDPATQNYQLTGVQFVPLFK